MGPSTVAFITAASSILGGLGSVASLFDLGGTEGPQEAFKPKTQAKDKSRGTLLARRSGRDDTIKTTPTGISGDTTALAPPTLTGR